MKSVFIIDSDKKFLSAAHKRLAGLDCTIKTFSRPKDAIQAFIEEVPAIIITEIQLPEISGMDMIRQMRSYNSSSCYIIMTSLGIELFADILRLNPEDVVDKNHKDFFPTLLQATKMAFWRFDAENPPRRNRRTAELLRVLVDTLPTGLLVIDNDDFIVIWNNTATAITGITSQNMRGKHISDVPAIIQQFIDPDLSQIIVDTDDGDTHYLNKTIQDINLEGDKKNKVVVFSDVTLLVSAKMDMENSLMELSETKDLMEEQAAQLTIALAELEEKNTIIEEQNKRMVHELEMAGELQKSLLPDIYQSFNGVSFASKYISSIQIGGDLYDVVDLGQGLTGFMIADVSGHGVAAALVASMFKMSFHTHAGNVASPKILYHMLNDELKQILNEDYITSFYLIVDRNQNTVTYSNAGHPNPLLYRRATGEIIELDTNGYFVGMFDDGDYEEKTISINEGDAILLYTDCIIETENKKGVQFGRERLIDLFAKTVSQNHGQEVIDLIEADLRGYAAKDTLEDDFTCLLLEFTELSEGPSSPEGTEDSHAGEFEEF